MPNVNSPNYPDLQAAIEGTHAPQEIINTLALVPVDYMNFDYRRASGQMVVATSLASDTQEIFGEIRDAKFPIYSVIPIVYFGHDDIASIKANNTSAFNYRVVEGTDKMSRHALGRAVDYNPLLNPYLRGGRQPEPGTLYYPGGYNQSVPGTIVDGDVVVTAHLARGWEWGGHWLNDIDYQHFYKPPYII